MTKSYLLIKLGPHKPLLVYGMAAFLWEKEKVPEQELQRYNLIIFHLNIELEMWSMHD